MRSSTVLFHCVLVLSYWRGESVMTTSEMVRISSYLEKLCPDVNVCSFVLPNNEISTFNSCCTDCFCDPDCEQLEPCCFEKPLDAQSNTDIQNYFMTNEEQCLYPKTGNPVPEDVTKYYSFYMVASISTTGASSATSCGSKPVAPWGSLYPVFSETKGKIYKNIECATVDNVTDAVLWDAYLVCDYKDNSVSQDFLLYISGIETGDMPSYCYVSFTYPKHFDDIRPNICFRSVIDSCAASDFDVPPFINASNVDIIKSCHSGLLTPYRTDSDIYVSVFCYLCSRLKYKESKQCLFASEKWSKTGRSAFSAMINAESLKQGNVEQNKSAYISKTRNVCLINKTESALESPCRPLLCPTGQVLVADTCMFLTKKWYDGFFTVAFRLVGNRDLNITDIFQMMPNQLVQMNVRMIPTFVSTLSKRWSTYHIYYEVTSTDALTKTIVLVLSREISEDRPELFITAIRHSLETNWRLVYRNQSVIMRPSLFPARTLTAEGAAIFRSGTFIENNTISATLPSYRLVHYLVLRKPKSIRVTKLYYCHQIELQSNEFDLSQDKEVLFNKITGRYLFDAEFTIINGFTGMKARLCLEDSGFE